MHARDVMTPAPLTVDVRSSVEQAAEVMQAHDVGDVLITDGTRLHGILTDRDIVVRAIAGRRPATTPAGACCSTNLYTVQADDTIHDVVGLMRQHALRRLPVLEGGELVGIVTIGDLARADDPKSALADISAAPPNK